MQFLKTLFWVLLAVFIALFASRNWSDATLNLWGDIQVDIKLPVLMAVMFLLGFLPVFLLHRTRLWTLKRRLEVEQRQQAIAAQSAQTDDAASAI
jgi:uncharacterized integral membrane protein